MTGPKVFISYSHDSDEHKAWVRKFAEALRANSVDAMLDQWDTSPGQDLAGFMSRGIRDAERVLMICSETYVVKAEEGRGGVGYEGLIVTKQVVEAIDTKKFVPIIRSNPKKSTPTFLGHRRFVDLDVQDNYDIHFQELLRELLGAPEHKKPPLGPNPFAGEPKAAPTIERVAGPTGLTQKGERVLDEPWFEQERKQGLAGLKKLTLGGSMEVRFGLHDPTSASQIELLEAVRGSQITTFGWPIGLILDREEYRPRPYADGIRAEIAIPQDSLMGRPSYDYWALRENGDYYTIQSLFEDYKQLNQIFFNTRIVRVTETLLFAANLYTALGVPSETKLSVRVRHDGLKGRSLTAVGNRAFFHAPTTNETAAQKEIVQTVGGIRENLVADVKLITAPMFSLFDFQKFSDDVYADIITRFVKGETS